MKTKDKKSIIILTVLALILITSFLFIGVIVLILNMLYIEEFLKYMQWY